MTSKKGGGSVKTALTSQYACSKEQNIYFKSVKRSLYFVIS